MRALGDMARNRGTCHETAQDICHEPARYLWQMAEDALWQRRFVLLLEQFEQEHGSERGWKSRLAKDLGQDPSTINKVTTQARPVTHGLVTAAITELGVHPDFFYNPALGDAPDYRQFVGRAETRVEREDDAVHPVVEQVLRERHASPEAAARLRAVPLRAFGGSPDPFTVATILSAIEADVRREAAGEAPEPKEPPPVPEGRRRVPPGKKGR